MTITAAHWVYLVGMVIIVAIMITRKNVVVPAVTATFLTAWVFTGDLIRGIGAIFQASLVAAGELFSIFLIIALVTALLGALRAMGADRSLVAPFRVLIRNPMSGFFALFVSTFMISLFFWPTPAVPLIGAILLPVAIRAGLPAMVGAMVIAIAGQGMALSADYVIQVAPSLSAMAAGIEPGPVADKALVLSVITGVTALVIIFLMHRKKFQKPSDHLLAEWESLTSTSKDELKHDHAALHLLEADNEEGIRYRRAAKLMAFLTAIGFALVVVYMLIGKFTPLVPEVTGSAAAALVGGTASILMLIAAFINDGPREALETTAEHTVDGLVFAFKAMGIVIPIAGFFFMGNSDFSGKILGMEEGQAGPGFLFDLLAAAQGSIPQVPVAMAIGIVLIGIATGLDGSGFSGLPLTGALAGSVGPVVGADVSTLAALGQLGSIWTGGGTLIAWSSVIAVAGVARVSVIELTRNLLIPVLAGLTVATIVASIFFL